MAKRVQRSKAEREAFWRRQFDDWRQSGQTITAFCRERGLSESAFHLWKRQLHIQTKAHRPKVNVPRSSSHRLVPVSVTTIPAALFLEVQGATLHIEAGVDEVLLRTVLNVLRDE